MGRCGQSVTLEDSVEVRSIRVAYDRLFFIHRTGTGGGGGGAGGADNAGVMSTLPLDFESTSMSESVHDVEDVVGSIAVGSVGSKHVYFAGQSSTKIYACDASGCEVTDLFGKIASHAAFLAPAGETLYLLSASDGNRLLSVAIDPSTGVPGNVSTDHVSGYAAMPAGAGVLDLFFAPPNRLYWSSWDNQNTGDGCVYRAEIDEPFLISSVPCWSEKYVSWGMVVATDGTVYAQVGDTTEIKKIVDGTPPVGSSFVSSTKGPARAVDDHYLYVTAATGGAIRVLPLDGGDEVLGPPSALDVKAIDASHPDYLFYTAGNTIHRWPKPKR